MGALILLPWTPTRSWEHFLFVTQLNKVCHLLRNSFFNVTPFALKFSQQSIPVGPFINATVKCKRIQELGEHPMVLSVKAKAT